MKPEGNFYCMKLTWVQEHLGQQRTSSLSLGRSLFIREKESNPSNNNKQYLEMGEFTFMPFHRYSIFKIVKTKTVCVYVRVCACAGTDEPQYPSGCQSNLCKLILSSHYMCSRARSAGSVAISFPHWAILPVWVPASLAQVKPLSFMGGQLSLLLSYSLLFLSLAIKGLVHTLTPKGCWHVRKMLILHPAWNHRIWGPLTGLGFLVGKSPARSLPNVRCPSGVS